MDINIKLRLFFLSCHLVNFININMYECMFIQSANHCFISYETEGQRNSDI